MPTSRVVFNRVTLKEKSLFEFSRRLYSGPDIGPDFIMEPRLNGVLDQDLVLLVGLGRVRGCARPPTDLLDDVKCQQKNLDELVVLQLNSPSIQ